MFSFLFYAFLAYLLYRLIFHFIIPIYRTTKQVKRSFRSMHEQMHQNTPPHNPAHKDEPYQKPGKGKVGDYIDFEEVKE